MGYAVEYVGRDASASPATGSHEVHVREQREVVEAAFGDSLPYLVRASGPPRARLAASGRPGREERVVAPARK
jgi:2-oxoglutarate dehydrogenase E1 component